MAAYRVHLPCARFLAPLHPQPVRAIAALHTLRSLSLYGQSADTYGLLHECRAPLRVLTLHSTPPRSPNASSTWRRPSKSSTSTSTSSLSIRPKSAPCKARRPLPARHTSPLRIPRARPDVLRVPRPVRELQGKVSEDEHARLRAANQRAQEQEGGGAWTKLDCVACDALVFKCYVLGLCCPTRLAMLDVAPGTGSAFTSLHCCSAAREPPVPRLKLLLMLDDGLGVMFDRLFDSPAVTHLTLCLVYNGTERAPGSEPPSRWPRTLMDVVYATIATDVGPPPCHALTHLCLVVHSNAVENENENADDTVAFARALRRCRPTSQSSSSNEREGAGAGEEAAATPFGALPSLQYVFLTVSGTFRTCAWPVATLHPEANSNGKGSARELDVTRVGDVDGEQEQGSTLVELHDGVAETIIQVEELVLSRKDELPHESESTSETETTSTWRDIATSTILADGFYTHPQCGEAFLAYNRARMLDATQRSDVQPFSPLHITSSSLTPDPNAGPRPALHRIFTQISFRPNEELIG
ncbi:hypothetical protein V8D89_002269 [Ganoderma adspersum]